MSVHRDIFKHSTVYGLGVALSRMASVLLLPFYTRFLSPADYGIIALLDLTTAIVNNFAAGGIYGAVMRYHFDPRFKDRQHDLWTTGLVMLIMISAPQLLLVWFLRRPIADLAFGADIVQGASYLSLALLGLPARLFSAFAQGYLRAEKRSVLFVGVSVPGLALRLALNIYLIGFRGMGIYGFLWGSLIGGVAEALAYGLILFVGKPVRIIREMIGPMWQYGWPLIVTALAGLAMHQMNRFMMRWLIGDLGPIGTFAVAYQLAQGVNQVVIVPFQWIWTAIMFEIDLMPDRKQLFQRVFKYYALAIALALMAVAVLSVPIVRIVASPEFAGAADVLPWLCFAFYFFTLHSLLRVPAMIHQRTISVARVSIVAAVVNFFANLAFIPFFGILGAAFASTVTYAVFSLLGHLAYRKIEDLEFPLAQVGWVTAGGLAIGLAQRAIVGLDASMMVEVTAGIVSMLVACAAVAVGPARPLFQRDAPIRRLLSEVLRKAKASS